MHRELDAYIIFIISEDGAKQWFGMDESNIQNLYDCTRIKNKVFQKGT